MRSLLPALAVFAGLATVATSEELDIGVVFPRQNESYAPTETFPIVFALQNAKLAKHLRPEIAFDVYNSTSNITFDGRWQLREWTNYSSEPFLLYRYADLRTEGPHALVWQAAWLECNGTDEEPRVSNDVTDRMSINFNIQAGAREANLVETTASEGNCSGQSGMIIDVTGQTRNVPDSGTGSYPERAGTCAVLAPPSPTSMSNPCRVRINEAMVESMRVTERERICSAFPAPADCPQQNSAMQALVVISGTAFLAACGAAAFALF